MRAYSWLLAAVCLLFGACHSLRPSVLWPAPASIEIPNRPQDGAVATLSAVGVEWIAAPGVIERALSTPLAILKSEDVEHGQTRTKHLTLYSKSEGLTFEVKWKAAKPSLDGVNNAPRREIAAYLVQRLVLDPEDYVVPTTSLLCLPKNALPNGAIGAGNLAGATCVVGAVSLWLHNVGYPERKIDWHRFRREPVYAYHAANLNLMAILMDHSDTHSRNLLVSNDPQNRRMFSIDNGISFNSWFRSPFSRDWNRLRVPALRAESIERLRNLRREDLEFLRVVAELRRGPGGQYVPVEPGPALNRRRGVRIGEGVIQLGLTHREIEGVWSRRNKLLELVDRGVVAVF